MVEALSMSPSVVTGEKLWDPLVNRRMLPVVFEAYPPSTTTLAHPGIGGSVEISLKHD